MSKWNSRLTLEITDVRVQRLQEINEADCWAEGIQKRLSTPSRDTLSRMNYSPAGAPIDAYKIVWKTSTDLILGRRNPWVWR